MGHSYAEMDPIGHREQTEFVDRWIDIRESLNNIPLNNFTVKDLSPLLRITGFDAHQKPRPDDLAYMQGRIEEIIAANTPPNPDLSGEWDLNDRFNDDG